MRAAASFRLARPGSVRGPLRALAPAAAALVLFTGLTACSGSGAAGGGTSAAAQTLTITVKDKRVTPSPHIVDLAVGQQLSLTVTSDTSRELHIHGFEVEKKLTAGRPQTLTLTGKDRGTFEVELHDPDLLLAKIAVR